MRRDAFIHERKYVPARRSALAFLHAGVAFCCRGEMAYWTKLVHIRSKVFMP
jgi:hypothetical protein